MLGCNKASKHNSSNTFYVNYVTINDTFQNILKKTTSGKVSYYDNDKILQIVPITYVTEEHPNTHYFMVMDELPAKPEDNTIKYEITFNNSMINDSIFYSVKKYRYVNNGWKTKSEMGTIKVFDYLSERDKNLRILKDRVASSVFRTIVADTYDK